MAVWRAAVVVKGRASATGEEGGVVRVEGYSTASLALTMRAMAVVAAAASMAVVGMAAAAIWAAP